MGQSYCDKEYYKRIHIRKSLLDNFFTKLTLNSSSDIRFQNSDSLFIDRAVAYCEDLPGFIAYKKIFANVYYSDYILNIARIDDGKGMLKITLNWSKVIKFRGRNQIIGHKCYIILAIAENIPKSTTTRILL